MVTTRESGCPIVGDRVRRLLGAVVLLGSLVTAATTAGAVAHAAVPTCVAPATSESVSTGQPSYGPGTTVAIAVTIRNSGSTACTASVGPSSPYVTVTNAAGAVVWNDCSGSSGAGGCAMFLRLVTVKADSSFVERFSWSERVSSATSRAPAGLYTLAATFGGSVHRSVAFALADHAPRTLALVVSDGGRTFSVRRGDVVRFTLAGPSSFVWTAPVSSSPAVLAAISTTLGAATTAVFVAGADGAARVTSTGKASCSPQCLTPVRVYSVTIRVGP